MDKPYLIATAAIGYNDNTWQEHEFNLGFVKEEDSFDRALMEDKIAKILEEEDTEYAFVAIMFHEEIYDIDSDDESLPEQEYGETYDEEEGI